MKDLWCPCSICADDAKPHFEMPDFRGGHDWAICKRGGVWRIYQWRPRSGWVWHDSEYTLPDAHTAATQYAACDETNRRGRRLCGPFSMPPERQNE